MMASRIGRMAVAVAAVVGGVSVALPALAEDGLHPDWVWSGNGELTVSDGIVTVPVPSGPDWNDDGTPHVEDHDDPRHAERDGDWSGDGHDADDGYLDGSDGLDDHDDHDRWDD